MDTQTISTAQSADVATYDPGKGDDAILLELLRRAEAFEAPPSFRELATLFKVKPNAITYYVRQLRDADMIHGSALCLKPAGASKARRLRKAM